MEKEINFVQSVAKEVADLGGKVYFVGGYVRDKFLNLPNKDIDVEVYGLSMEELETLLSRYGVVEQIGSSFGILMVKGYDIDFALPRTESKIGNKHTDFKVVVDSDLSVLEASKRRDFTMNAILQDVLTGKFIDLYGGISDIENKVIRFVNEETYKEDELRAFRACQFASRFNFTIDPKVIEASKEFQYSLSKERIFEEINKALLKSNKPSIAFNYLFEMGIVEKLFPELFALKGCEQSKINHPEGDVWEHTLLVLDESVRLKNSSKRPLSLMYTALCHDMGKPNAQNILPDGKITFYNHEILGVPISERFLKRLTNDKQLLKDVTTLTRYHMHGHKVLEMKESTLRKLMVKVDIEELLLVAEADEKGKGREKVDYTKQRQENVARISSLSNGSFGKIEPYFKGSDLIQLGYKPGVEMGQLLKEVYESQLNGQSKEHIKSYLVNKINPKQVELQVPDVIDITFNDLIKNDKRALDNSFRRIEWFNQLEKDSNEKYPKTKNRIPYLIVLSSNKKYKYVFTPVMALQVSLNNVQHKVIFDTKNNKIDERNLLLKDILNDVYRVNTAQVELFKKVFLRLNAK